MHDKVMATRQLATCLYFIDKLALRAGNEKGEEEADTVGKLLDIILLLDKLTL